MNLLKYFTYPFLPHVHDISSPHLMMLKLNERDIKRYIPLREESLMADQALITFNPIIKAGGCCTEYYVDEKSPLLNGHFPGFPTLKAVLTLETMNVAAIILGTVMFPEIKVLFSTFKKVTEFECSGSPIVPGDNLDVEVEFLQMEKKRQFLLFSFTGTVKRDGKIVAQAGSFTGTVITGK